MFINTIHNTKLFFLLSILLVLSGCIAQSRVTSRSSYSNNASKLQSAHVVWIDNTSYQIEINKVARNYEVPTIGEGDKLHAKQVIGNLIVSFRKSVVTKTREALSRNAVVDGDEVILELTPFGGRVESDGGRGLILSASIKRPGSTQEIWWVTINVRGGYKTNDEALMDKFVSELKTELKSAGWII